MLAFVSESDGTVAGAPKDHLFISSFSVIVTPPYGRHNLSH